MLSGIIEPLEYFFCSEMTGRGKEEFCAAAVSSSFVVCARDPIEAFVKSCCPELIRFASFQSGVDALSSSSSPISKQPLHHSTGRMKFNHSFRIQKHCRFAILNKRDIYGAGLSNCYTKQ